MPQNPLVPRAGGNKNALNITEPTVLKGAPGTLYKVIVNTAGSTVGGIYDFAAATGEAAANLIANIPDTANAVINLEFPCAVGILIVPGTGQVVSASFS